MRDERAGARQAPAAERAPRRTRLALGALLALALLYGGYRVATMDATMFECSDEVRVERKSPDGAVVATLFVRNCGATTGYTSVVNLRDSSAPFDGDANFDALVAQGDCDVGVAWGAGTLTLLVPPGCEVVRSAASWRGTRIVLARR